MENEVAGISGLQIVIADDDWQDHELIKKAIKECHLKNVSTSVFNGQQLLNLLLKEGFHKNTKRPDLILLDLKMDTMDGFTALEKLKENPELRNIPVHVLSDSDAPLDKAKAAVLGAKSYMVKPISYIDLARIIKEVCDEHRRDHRTEE